MRENLKIFRGLRPRPPAAARSVRFAHLTHTHASLTKIHRNLGDFECVEPGGLNFLEGKWYKSTMLVKTEKSW